MKNANKPHKILDSAMVRGVKRNPYRGPDHHTHTHNNWFWCMAKVNQFFWLVGPITTASFNEMGWLLLQ